MDEGKIGHHHAKCLRPTHSAENLSADSFQLIGYFVGQWEHECGIDTLKWNVQPLVVVKRDELRLRRLCFEMHDDMFSEGVLLPDFQYSKELIEIALGESGIDGKPPSNAFRNGTADDSYRSVGICTPYQNLN